MASARKKQDEKNLKTLRELVSLPHNKYCFDCNQRGPTYVNVTIGSFVCTKCSGMLRGLTPPHRVKSISMATFTSEEVELVQNRGNDYCRRTWLGLYEGAPVTEGRDEQQIHDLMVDKYERRRYYLDQPVSSGNNRYYLDQTVSSNSGSNTLNNSSNTTATSTTTSNVNGSTTISRPNGGLTIGGSTKPLSLKKDSSSLLRQSPLRLLNGASNGVDIRMKNNGITIARPAVPTSTTHKTDFIANFDSADIFNAANNNNSVISNGVQQSTHAQQPSFANFDNNPVFTNTNPFILPNLQDRSTCQNQWTTLFDSADVIDNYSNDNACVQNSNNINQQKNTANVPPAPPEDRYAALKDLDNAFKNQSTLDWNSSNSSLYSSPTPTSSMYNSSSPQSIYGSPSQGQFTSIFSQQETGSNTSNPFNSGQLWGNSSTVVATATPMVNGMTNGSNPNPFRMTATAPTPDPFKMNGFSQSFQQAFTPINGSAWTANPFKVTSNGHSNNPFL